MIFLFLLLWSKDIYFLNTYNKSIKNGSRNVVHRARTVKKELF